MIFLVLLQYYYYWIPSNVPSILEKGPSALGTTGLRLVDTLADLDEFPTAVISFADPRGLERSQYGTNLGWKVKSE